MDFVDVDSEKWQEYGRTMAPPLSWVYRAEARQLQTHERKAAARASRSLVVTDEERAVLERTTGWTTTTVVPNGVDLDYFAPPASPSDRPVIVVTGAMDYPPNVEGACWFAQRVLPLVRAVVPAASFVIAGKNPVRRVRRLAALPGVVVTGTVPDIRPHLHEAAVAVSPLRIARGVQNKILEAMATALPVVATTAAHRGLLARPSTDLLVAETPDQFATAVTTLLQSPAERRAIGDAGRRFVETHHAWPTSLAMIDAVLAEALPAAIAPSMLAERV
jgi:sugar transferase (PEP-CTERM/EpsH1 system associated)